MANYTMTIREICQAVTNDFSPVTDPETLIANAAPLIFSFPYPFWDCDKKQNFECMILRNFFLEEIGRETYQEWKMRLQNWLVINMPYYNKLYTAINTEFDILGDVNVTRTHDETSSGTSKATSNGTNNSTVKGTGKYSDTPQGSITNLQQDKYLTNAQISETTNSGIASGLTTGEDNRTGKYTETVKGKQGMQSNSSMIREYMEAMKNIDKRLLEDMEVLFMGVM